MTSEKRNHRRPSKPYVLEFAILIASAEKKAEEGIFKNVQI